MNHEVPFDLRCLALIGTHSYRPDCSERGAVYAAIVGTIAVILASRARRAALASSMERWTVGRDPLKIGDE